MKFVCRNCQKTYRMVGKRIGRTLCIDCEEAALREMLRKQFQAA